MNMHGMFFFKYVEYFFYNSKGGMLLSVEGSPKTTIHQ